MSQDTDRPAIEAFAAERHYRPATVERWLANSPENARALFALAHELRLGENQLRDLWDCAEEIAARDGTTLAAVLDSPAVRAARACEVGRNDKLKRLKDTLRRLRYPQLAAAEQRLHRLIQELDLPRHVQVNLPAFLEGDTLRLEIDVDSPQGLRVIADALQRAAQSAACAEIFALLEEAP